MPARAYVSANRWPLLRVRADHDQKRSTFSYVDQLFTSLPLTAIMLLALVVPRFTLVPVDPARPVAQVCTLSQTFKLLVSRIVRLEAMVSGMANFPLVNQLAPIRLPCSSRL